MEYSKYFYITLFSNASQKVRFSNTLSVFTIQLVQRIDMGLRQLGVGLCEFSCPPPYSHTVKPYEPVDETNALIYCDLITQQFVGSDVSCLRTFIHSSKYCDHALYIMYPSKNAPFRT
jgi:hypothetical protein